MSTSVRFFGVRLTAARPPEEEETMRHLRLLVTGLFVALILVVSQAQMSSAQTAGASLEIHKRVCPAGATGNIFDDCHGNPPTQTTTFSVDGGAATAVDASGNVTFTGLAAGDHTVTEVEGIPLEFANLRVFCSVEGDATGAVEVTTTGPDFTVTLADGQHMICDSYSLPINLSGLTPTPSTGGGTTPTPAIQLPNTGSGFDGGSGPLGLLSIFMVAISLGVAALALVRRPASKRVRADR
jgi:hypothetical protein